MLLDSRFSVYLNAKTVGGAFRNLIDEVNPNDNMYKLRTVAKKKDDDERFTTFIFYASEKNDFNGEVTYKDLTFFYRVRTDIKDLDEVNKNKAIEKLKNISRIRMALNSEEGSCRVNISCMHDRIEQRANEYNGVTKNVTVMSITDLRIDEGNN